MGDIYKIYDLKLLIMPEKGNRNIEGVSFDSNACFSGSNYSLVFYDYYKSERELTKVILHELFHMLGAKHSYNKNDDLMNKYYVTERIGDFNKTTVKEIEGFIDKNIRYCFRRLF